MNINNRPANFRARITILTGAGGGPGKNTFGFPENGARNVPMKVDGIDGLNSIQVRYVPGFVAQVGDSIEVDCALLSPELFVGRLSRGMRFSLAGGAIPFAEGEILSSIPD